MTEQAILKELNSVKSKMAQMDKELRLLREEFEDAHLNADDKRAIAAALEDEKNRKTVSLAEVRKRLGV